MPRTGTCNRRADYVTGDEAGSSSRNFGRFIAAIPAAKFQLNDVENKLRASGLYTPVAHVAWTQTPSDWGTRAGFTVQKLGVNVDGLTGTVFLELGPICISGWRCPMRQRIRRQAWERVPEPRSRWANRGVSGSTNAIYYNHPAFGVIALVTPAQGARPAGR